MLSLKRIGMPIHASMPALNTCVSCTHVHASVQVCTADCTHTHIRTFECVYALVMFCSLSELLQPLPREHGHACVTDQGLCLQIS